MTSPLSELAELSGQFEAEAAEVADAAAWDALRIRWLGRKQGIVRARLAAFKEVPAEERRDYGQAVNALKQKVESGLADIEARLAAAAAPAEAEELDVTLPGRRPMLGSIHPVSRVAAEGTGSGLRQVRQTQKEAHEDDHAHQQIRERSVHLLSHQATIVHGDEQKEGDCG